VLLVMVGYSPAGGQDVFHAARFLRSEPVLETIPNRFAGSVEAPLRLLSSCPPSLSVANVRPRRLSARRDGTCDRSPRCSFRRLRCRFGPIQVVASRCNATQHLDHAASSRDWIDICRCSCGINGALPRPANTGWTSQTNHLQHRQAQNSMFWPCYCSSSLTDGLWAM